MDTSIYTILVTIGIASFLGSCALCGGLGLYIGRSTALSRIKQNYRLIPKSLWAAEEHGLVLNVTRKKIVLSAGDERPQAVTVSYSDHSVVLKTTSVAPTESTLGPPSDGSFEEELVTG